MMIRPPRFGTSCQRSPLESDRSTGFTTTKLVMYSTMPFAFVGAMPMSVMSALCESFGSSSPHARPITVSYAMACPVSGEVLSTTIFVIRACEPGTQATRIAAATAAADQLERDVRFRGTGALLEKVARRLRRGAADDALTRNQVKGRRGVLRDEGRTLPL